MTSRLRLVSVSATPLTVPLREPFVIATARMDTTRAALVRVVVERTDQSEQAEGIGEAAALPPVTLEDQPDILRAVESRTPGLVDEVIDVPEGVDALLDELFADHPVTRAGVQCAILDAAARLDGVPLHRWLGGTDPAPALHTDITIPIATSERMAELGRAYRERGFDRFKVKVGRRLEADREALLAIHAAVPDARFRLDANEGYRARDALALLDAVLEAGLAVECFEQPCRRDDVAGMAEVTARSAVPVVADESVRSLADLEAVAKAGAAHAANLKLVKMGGPLGAVAVARRAGELGLRLMAGAMVETRLGLTAMAHVIAAIGGVDWVDLDTAFLLTDDPFRGGYRSDGPELTLLDAPGLGCAYKSVSSREF